VIESILKVSAWLDSRWKYRA